ncbi:bestrophin family protein [Dyadobacter psychrotolerans]|uniref:Multidrug transporter n=1 Tax=Dyadobacter psychrotolerans TaxID=2541721 RepID=A0A4R5E0S8_9BACT|nr:bestrophin family ion channel [Dyadobacter psychrotolerans]TDE17223.1 multidrug transporter [Dyadobacter psychrotolerans]
MHIGSHYNLKTFILWTRRTIYWLVLWAIIPTTLFKLAGFTWLAIPWVPIALIGTATSFIAGFKNTQTYNRLWEARQIWGGIVNSSRTFGIMVTSYIRTGDGQQKSIHREIIYRHIAWLTALRFQLRESKNWENIKTKSYNIEFRKLYSVEEWEKQLPDELKPFLSETDRNYVLSTKNRATQIIALQSDQLRSLADRGSLDPLYYVELENVLKEFYDHQGKSERIKNFPYPRQFASINLFFVRLLVILLPFGMLNEFAKLGEFGIWLNIPFSVVVSWVFTSLEQVGESTENPFEGGPNDVPVTSMSRTIEIDLREMLGEKLLPPPVPANNEILM